MSAVDHSVDIVCVGAGPAALMLIERLSAQHSARPPACHINIVCVDPFPPGGGRIWRRDQSPLLKLNSMVRDVAVFPDSTCVIDGPIVPGLTLWEWVLGVRAGEVPTPDWADERLLHEIATICEDHFPTRRLNNGYLSWAWDEVLRRAHPTLRVSWLADRVDAVSNVDEFSEGDVASGQHKVLLGSGGQLVADVVVYALGHAGSDLSAESVQLSEFAVQHDLVYMPPSFTADADLSGVRSGATVIVRGMGLAAIDLIVMLTEGRGGRFVRSAGGSLSYTPSGLEPLLHVGSRRGVPYRSKVTSALVGAPLKLSYLGLSFQANIAARTDLIDFERDVWPLISAELITGYYRELFTGHPDRVRGNWELFQGRLDPILQDGGWHSTAFAKLIHTHVPEAIDRFDLGSFDRPLDFSVPAAGQSEPDVRTPEDDRREDDAAAVQGRVMSHIATDLILRTSAAHSATQALFLTALLAFSQISEIPAERWTARSRAHSIPRHWFSYFSYLASGPPAHRLEELLALAEAGVVQFLGGDVELVSDTVQSCFVASGRAVVAGNEALRVPGDALTDLCVARTRVESAVLIDAWLPEADAGKSENTVLRDLVQQGRMRELSIVDRPGGPKLTTGRIEVDEAGLVAGARTEYAVGPFTVQLTGGAFTRPNMNSLPFRVHDRCARSILETVARVAVRRGSLVSV